MVESEVHCNPENNAAGAGSQKITGRPQRGAGRQARLDCPAIPITRYSLFDTSMFMRIHEIEKSQESRLIVLPISLRSMLCPTAIPR